MKDNWEEVKWIFQSDGTLRDIYVENINIEDWKILIDYLNENHIVNYGPVEENKNKIDKNYITQYLLHESKEMEVRTASVIIDNLIINTHFFCVDEIEFDIAPKQIDSFEDYEKIIKFMNEISRVLDKSVILTGENQIDFPLIEVDFSKNIRKALTQKEAEKLWK